ncbi:MAG: prolipoprotein diacylglyceryl transferase [Clostridiales bacterium]|nr:prolipoprotein diacylglyceryl transferase [Clostridiales bacterium]
MEKSDILFRNLGIEFSNLGTGISIFGIDIAFYGIVIAIGMVCGVLLAQWQAKRTGQNPDTYWDFALYGIIFAVIGARLYYVAFSWDEFKDNLLGILNLRTGGLAIYGGIIAAVLTAIIYCKIKKISFGLLADTSVLGLILGQVIGRWGNFFNREAFGKYYNGLFSMQLNLAHVGGDYTCSMDTLNARYATRPEALKAITEIRNHTQMIDGVKYISVHPTFLYESVWNLLLLICLIVYSKHKKFDGEILCLYFAGYGLGRLWIEGLRTDQLFMWNSPLAVSQVLSGCLVVGSVLFIVWKRISLKKKKN